MERLEGTLYQRLNELIQAHQGEKLLSVTATSVAVEELATRTAGLEKAIREIALEVEKLATTQKN